MYAKRGFPVCGSPSSGYSLLLSLCPGNPALCPLGLWVLGTQHGILCSPPSHMSKHADRKLKIYQLFEEEIMPTLMQTLPEKWGGNTISNSINEVSLPLYRLYTKKHDKKSPDLYASWTSMQKNSKPNFSQLSSTRYKNDSITWLGSLPWECKFHLNIWNFINIIQHINKLKNKNPLISILVHLCWYNKISLTGWLIKNRNWFLHSGSWKFKIEVPVWLSSGEGLLPGS